MPRSPVVGLSLLTSFIEVSILKQALFRFVGKITQFLPAQQYVNITRIACAHLLRLARP